MTQQTDSASASHESVTTDDHADGAHRGMTVQMEHTTCEDPLTDDAAVVSEFDLILLFSLVSLQNKLSKYDANQCKTLDSQ